MVVPKKNPDEKPRVARLRILLVEDHTETATAMERILEGAGFSARSAPSYRDALKLAGEWIPDALVADIGLPGKDGWEVMKTMRLAYPSLKGVVVSGHSEPEYCARSREAGFSEHLAKPVNPEKLIEALRRLFDADLPGEGRKIYKPAPRRRLETPRQGQGETQTDSPTDADRHLSDDEAPRWNRI